MAKRNKLAVFSVVALGMMFFAEQNKACTRAVYLGPDDMIVTGRTMDWKEDPQSNIYLFPRGMEKRGGVTDNTVTWTSKYGSVVTAGYDIGVCDGMNEKGLVANLLFLTESSYHRPNDSRPVMGLSIWTQYVLDNFATVDEAVNELSLETFRIDDPDLPNGAKSTLHLSISDATGNSAIFEYINGNLIIHEGRECQIMTNSPTYDKQLTLNDYWKEIGGLVMLPGTNRASDRFVRASFYIQALPQTDNFRQAVAGVFSVMRNVSVPLGISIPEQPNIASTRCSGEEVDAHGWRDLCGQCRRKVSGRKVTSLSVWDIGGCFVFLCPNKNESNMIGAIAGDIIGSVYEFDNIKTTVFPFFTRKSNYTDDTIMTVAVTDWLLYGGNLVQVMHRYGREFPCPMGGYGARFGQWLCETNPQPYNSWGNGSAMRVSAVGWAFGSLEKTLQVAEETAAVSHNHPEGIKGAQAVAAAIYLARTGKSKQAIREYIETTFLYDLNFSCDEIRPDYCFNPSCQGTVPEAIVAFLESTDFETAIRLAISLGGDSDTLACITGGIAEAFYGMSEDWKIEVLRRLPEAFVEVVEEFYQKI